ncbi:hypothetical protein V494_05731 [Pseudogymnoascus sp. VKM F-4513 (FW-928)]|nr:hypothetical protein V494_05731 [Pseudogymnoascus sp. VKM F-4513 (FW-928)]
MASTTAPAPPAEEQPWHAAFPSPKSVATPVSREQMRDWLTGDKVPGKDFVLVDLRRNDYKGGMIRGSINLPAQSLYSNIPQLFNLFSAAGVKTIVWYCGSSLGRGGRAAGWFQDYIKEQGKEGDMKSCTLTGGIKGWVAAGEEYVALVDGILPSRIWRSRRHITLIDAKVPQLEAVPLLRAIVPLDGRKAATALISGRAKPSCSQFSSEYMSQQRQVGTHDSELLLNDAPH